MTTSLLLGLVALGLFTSLAARLKTRSNPPIRALNTHEQTEVRALVREGKEVEAVRRYRQLTHASLQTAVKQVQQLSI
jgi:hypothetical protein